MTRLSVDVWVHSLTDFTIWSSSAFVLSVSANEMLQDACIFDGSVCWILNASQPVKHLIRLFKNIFFASFSVDKLHTQLINCIFRLLFNPNTCQASTSTPSVVPILTWGFASWAYFVAAICSKHLLFFLCFCDQEENKIKETCSNNNSYAARAGSKFQFCSKHGTPDFWVASDFGEMSSPLFAWGG